MSSSLTPSASKTGGITPKPLGNRSNGTPSGDASINIMGRHTWQERAMGLAPKLLTAYVFFIFSRLFEVSLLLGFGNLYVMLIISSVSLLVIFLGGDFLRAASTPSGLLLLAFTFWAVLILPFSSWRSESLDVFTSVWIKSAAAFFIIAGLSRSIDHTRKVFIALGIGALVSLALIVLPTHTGGDRLQSFGSLGNANEVAFHLMLGLPFLAFLMTRVNVFWRIPLAAACLLSVVYSLKTVSRAGIIIGVALFLIAFFQVSFANKIKILMITVAGAVIGLLMLDQASVSRYLTLVNPNSGNDTAALSARESADARKYKLEQSIELTFLHPLTGVGMGVFVPASAELSYSKGEKALWIASHNAYTEISSETGIPGFLLMVGVFITCYIRVIRLGRTARRLGLQEIHTMCLCALLGLVALTIHFFFDSIAWDYYLPMIGGMCTALVFSAQPLIAKAQEDAEHGEAAESALVQAIHSADSGAAASLALFAEQPNPKGSNTKAAPPRPRNPYRLGRRR